MYIKQVGPGILRALGPREAEWVGAGPGRGGGEERLPGGPRVGLGSGCSRGFPWGAAAACQGLVGRRGPRARGGLWRAGRVPLQGWRCPDLRDGGAASEPAPARRLPLATSPSLAVAEQGGPSLQNASPLLSALGCLLLSKGSSRAGGRRRGSCAHRPGEGSVLDLSGPKPPAGSPPPPSWTALPGPAERCPPWACSPAGWEQLLPAPPSVWRLRAQQGQPTLSPWTPLHFESCSRVNPAPARLQIIGRALTGF